jgi:hypothetical protein
MIKKWNDFENFENFGNRIEKLLKNDDLRDVILNNLDIDDGLDPTVSVKSIVNNLSKSKKDNLRKVINSTLDGGVNESWGYNTLNTFFKSLTALQITGIEPDIEPGDFLLKHTWNVDYTKLENVFSRFKSLEYHIGEYSSDIKVFYGIKGSNFLYGIIRDSIDISIGEFKLTNSNLNRLKSLEWKSSKWLKSELNTLNVSDIKILGNIKNALSNFTPNFYTDKSSIILKDSVISTSWKGYGNWTMGSLEQNDILEFKSSLKNYLNKFKFCNNVKVAVKSDDYWIVVFIKLK